MGEYRILRCTKADCGKLGIYCSGIATRCKHCGKPYKLKSATVIRRGIQTAQEASYILRAIQMEVAKTLQ